MATARVLLLVICTIAFCGHRVLGSNLINYKKYHHERQRKSATLIEAAQKEIGVREHLENSSPRIDQYCAYVGFQKIPWCAAWVSFCFGQTGYTQPKTAWSPALFPKGRSVKDPLPGCVFGIYFKNLGRIAHCGIVEGIRGDFVLCLEGNTNVAGSREGDAVMRKLRHRRSIAQYADWL